MLAVLAIAGTTQAMTVYAVTPAGKTLTLDVEASDTIENVKAKIQDKEAFVPELQWLYYGTTLLNDGNTLSDYNISAGKTITVTLRELGLGQPENAATVATPVKLSWHSWFEAGKTGSFSVTYRLYIAESAAGIDSVTPHVYGPVTVVLSASGLLGLLLLAFRRTRARLLPACCLILVSLALSCSDDDSGGASAGSSSSVAAASSSASSSVASASSSSISTALSSSPASSASASAAASSAAPAAVSVDSWTELPETVTCTLVSPVAGKTYYWKVVILTNGAVAWTSETRSLTIAP